MQLYKLKDSKLVDIGKSSFNLEKEIQQLVENNLVKLFGIEFIATEFSVGEFRLDTIAYDKENQSFVVIE